MEALKIGLLIAAYTIGITTITLQVICYLREIEYKETLFLTVSFLLLIITLALSELVIGPNPELADVNSFMVHIFSVILGITIPINIHKERVFAYEALMNRIILIVGALLLILSLVGLLIHQSKLVEYLVMAFLLITLLYSMAVSITTKPSLLIKHREKAERNTALFFLIFMPVYSATGMANHYFHFLDISFFDGGLLLSIIFIGLALSKMTDDMKRLSMFALENIDKITERAKLYQVSPRELEVANLLLKGCSYQQIAESLFISMPTVKTHVANIYKKTGVKNKVELINLLTG